MITRVLITLYLLVTATLCFGQIQITFPYSRAVFQRNQSNQATISIAGNYAVPIDKLEVQFTPVANGQGIATTWIPIKSNPSGLQGGVFTANVTINAGWYTMQVRGSIGGNIVGIATLDRVGVGEVFVIAGQSNAKGFIASDFNIDFGQVRSGDDRVNTVNWNNTANDNNDPPVPSFEHIERETLIAPAGRGSWCWGKLGDLLAAKWNVPVAFFSACWDASIVDNWSKSAAGLPTVKVFEAPNLYPAGQPYGNLKKALNYYANMFGVRAVLWHQGETDNIPVNTSQASYAASLQNVINKTRGHTGKNISWVVSRASITVGADRLYHASQSVIDGQNQVIINTGNTFAGPSTDGIQVPRYNNDPHFGGQGLIDLANAWNNSLDESFRANSNPQAPALLPEVSASCPANNLLTISVPGGYSSYEWFGNAGGNSNSITVGAGSYWLKLKDGLGNTSIIPALLAPSVSRPNTPTIGTSGGVTICQGSILTLYSSNGADNLWSTGSTAQAINVASAGTYFVKTRSAYCDGNTASLTVANSNIPPPSKPSVSKSGSTTFCQGGSVTLTSSYGGTSIWNTGTNATSLPINYSGTFVVTAVDGNGCYSPPSDPVAVVVNPTPGAPTISQGSTVVSCGGANVTLTSNYATGNSWKNTAGGIVSSAQNFVTNIANTYTVTYTDGNGCTSNPSAPTLLKGVPLPPTPVIIPQSPTTFCQGDRVILRANLSDYRYEWNGNVADQGIVVTNSGNFSLKITDGNGCQSATSAPVTIVVNPLPASPTIRADGPTTFCPDKKVTLIVSNKGNNAILWNNAETGTELIATITGSYFAQNKDANSCLSPPSNTIFISTLPALASPKVSVSGSTTICEGGSVKLTASGATFYEWSNGPDTQVLSNLITFSATKTGKYGVKAVPSNQSECASAYTYTNVAVNPLPAKPSIVAKRQKVFCEKDSTILESSAALRYRWYQLNNLISNKDTLRTLIVKKAGVYQVDVLDANACISPKSDTIIIVVNPLPAIPFITADGPTTICSDKRIVLTSTDETGYLWSNGAITKSISVNTTAAYTVKTINKFKCVSATSAAVSVVVNPIPNAPIIQAESDTIFCDGGSVNLKTASTLKITWYPSLEITPKIMVNKSGTYVAHSTDDKGCISTSSNAIFVKTKIVPSTPKIVPKGVFSLEAQGAIPGDTYAWKLNGNPLTEQSSKLKITQSGVYQVGTSITYSPVNTVAGKLTCVSKDLDSYTASNVEDAQIRLIVYPNPSSSGLFSIEAREELLGTDIVLYDLLGNVLLKKTIDSFKEAITLDLTQIPNGEVILKVQSKAGDYLLSKRIMINRQP